MEKEIRVVPASFEIRAAEGEPAHLIGHAAVFNERSANLGGFTEIIEPGFFDNVLNDDVRALKNHDSNLIVGRTKNKTLSISVDTKGLLTDCKLPKTSTGQDLRIEVESGLIDQMSFGFRVKPDGDSWDEDPDTGAITRKLLAGGCEKLSDITYATFGAYPQTDVAKRSLEEFQKAHPKPDPNDDLAKFKEITRKSNERNRKIKILELSISEA